MAERTAIFNLKVDDGNSAKKVAEAEKQLEKFRKSALEADKGTGNFQKRLQSINKVVKQNAFSLGEANRLIENYQTIAFQAGKDSPVGKEAIARAAELTDKMAKLRSETSNLANDGKNLQGAMQLSQGVVGGYQAFAGVTAMLGVENEELMQTMVKLQAVQQVSMGIEQARKSLEEGQAARLLLTNIRTKALTIGTTAYAGAQSLLNAAIGKGSKAMKIFRGALVATGIGAIVVGIGLLVSNWDKLTNAVSSSADALSDFVKESLVMQVILAPIKFIINGIISGLEALGIVESEQEKQAREMAAAKRERIEQERQAQRQAIRDRINNLNQERDALEKTIDFEISKRQAAGQSTTELEKQKMLAVIESNREQVESIDELIAALESEIRIKMMSGRFSIEEQNQIRELIKERNNLTNAIKSNAQNLEIFEIKQNKKARDQKEKDIEEEKKQEEARQVELQKIRDKATDLMIASIPDEEERKRMQLNIQHQREREQLIEKYGEDTELLKALETKQMDELINLDVELKAKQRASQKLTEEQQREEELLKLENDLLQMELDKQVLFDKEMELEIARRDALLANDELTAEERRKIELESAQRMEAINERKKQDEQKTAEAIATARMSVVDAAVNVLGELSSLAKEGSDASKALAIAEIAAQTAMGFVRGLGIAQQAAVNAGPAAPVVFGAFYASQIASVLAAANQAKGILGAGGGVSAPQASSAPSASRSDQSGGANMPNTRGINNSESNTQKVIVTETDITRTQKRVEDIEVRSIF